MTVMFSHLIYLLHGLTVYMTVNIGCYLKLDGLVVYIIVTLVYYLKLNLEYICVVYLQAKSAIVVEVFKFVFFYPLF
jgi:hypothetical protein